MNSGTKAPRELGIYVAATDDLARLFWERADKRGPDDCWQWLGSQRGGYGQLKYGGKYVKATHISLVLSGFPRPLGCIALHSCDNPPCVNPKHLRWGTDRQNKLDWISRVGKRAPFTRLSVDDVIAIKQRPDVPLRILAETFGVSVSTIMFVRTGRSYQHINPPTPEAEQVFLADEIKIGLN